MVLFGAFLLASSAHAVELVDDAGNHIDIPAGQPTVIALAPHLAELVFAIGAGEQLVGTVEWSNYPHAAKAVPRVGDAFRIDYEQVLGMQPDIVLAWASGTPRGVIERLQDFDIPVAVLAPTSLASIAEHVEWLGKALGHEQRATTVAEEFRQGLAMLRGKYADRPAVSVFYQISSQPLFTVNGDHPISEMIRVCGGRNVFSDLSSLAPAVTLEAVLGRDPEAIVMGESADENGAVERWRQWPDLAAVRHDNLLLINAEVLARSTPRILEGGRQLCRALDEARTRTGSGQVTD